MKMKELRALSNEDRKKKLEELKIELIKSKTDALKTGGAKIKKIKKIIARILTLENEPKENILLKSKTSKENSSATKKIVAEEKS